MTYAEAVEILENQEFAIQQRGEILAEMGMGAVSMGFDPYDAMTVARAQMDADVDPEAEREWAAKVAEAEAYVAAFPLRVVLVFPEFRRDDFLVGVTGAAEDDLPF